MKNGNEANDAFGDSQKRYRARGRDKKIRTALRTNIARFVTVPSEKKKYLDQFTPSKLLRKDRGCVQRFSIDADVSRSHFTSPLFCRGSQENLSTHVHINCFYLLNPLSHDLRALYSLTRCNSWISLLQALGFLLKTCWARLFGSVSHMASIKIFYRSFVYGSLPIQRMQLAELCFLTTIVFVSDGARSAHGRANLQRGGKSKILWGSSFTRVIDGDFTENWRLRTN